MALTSGFFNSSGGDRLYDAEDFNNYLSGLVEDGCYPQSTGFKVLPRGQAIMGDPGPSVKISAGKAYCNGLWVTNDTEYVYQMASTLTPASYHLLYFKFDTNDSVRAVSIEESISININAAVPTNASGVYYMPLARVADNLTAQPQAADITDKRTYAGVTAIVSDLGITEAKLANNAVGLSKLAKVGLFLGSFDAGKDSAFTFAVDTWQTFAFGGTILSNYTPAVDVILLILGGMNVIHAPNSSTDHRLYFGVNKTTPNAWEIMGTGVGLACTSGDSIAIPVAYALHLNAGTSYTINIGMSSNVAQNYSWLRAMGSMFVLPHDRG